MPEIITPHDHQLIEGYLSRPGMGREEATIFSGTDKEFKTSWDKLKKMVIPDLSGLRSLGGSLSEENTKLIKDIRSNWDLADKQLSDIKAEAEGIATQLKISSESKGSVYSSHVLPGISIRRAQLTKISETLESLEKDLGLNAKNVEVEDQEPVPQEPASSHTENSQATQEQQEVVKDESVASAEAAQLLLQNEMAALIQKLQSEVEFNRAELARVRGDLDDLKRRNVELIDDLKSAKEKISEIEAENARLKAELTRRERSPQALEALKTVEDFENALEKCQVIELPSFLYKVKALSMEPNSQNKNAEEFISKIVSQIEGKLRDSSEVGYPAPSIKELLIAYVLSSNSLVNTSASLKLAAYGVLTSTNEEKDAWKNLMELLSKSDEKFKRGWSIGGSVVGQQPNKAAEDRSSKSTTEPDTTINASDNVVSTSPDHATFVPVASPSSSFSNKAKAPGESYSVPQPPSLEDADDVVSVQSLPPLRKFDANDTKLSRTTQVSPIASVEQNADLETQSEHALAEVTKRSLVDSVQYLHYLYDESNKDAKVSKFSSAARDELLTKVRNSKIDSKNVDAWQKSMLVVACLSRIQQERLDILKKLAEDLTNPMGTYPQDMVNEQALFKQLSIYFPDIYNSYFADKRNVAAQKLPMTEKSDGDELWFRGMKELVKATMKNGDSLRFISILIEAADFTREDGRQDWRNEIVETYKDMDNFSFEGVDIPTLQRLADFIFAKDTERPEIFADLLKIPGKNNSANFNNIIVELSGRYAGFEWSLLGGRYGGFDWNSLGAVDSELTKRFSTEQNVIPEVRAEKLLKDVVYGGDLMNGVSVLANFFRDVRHRPNNNPIAIEVGELLLGKARDLLKNPKTANDLEKSLLILACLSSSAPQRVAYLQMLIDDLSVKSGDLMEDGANVQGLLNMLPYSFPDLYTLYNQSKRRGLENQIIKPNKNPLSRALNTTNQIFAGIRRRLRRKPKEENSEENQIDLEDDVFDYSGDDPLFDDRGGVIPDKDFWEATASTFPTTSRKPWDAAPVEPLPPLPSLDPEPIVYRPVSSLPPLRSFPDFSRPDDEFFPPAAPRTQEEVASNFETEDIGTSPADRPDGTIFAPDRIDGNSDRIREQLTQIRQLRDIVYTTEMIDATKSQNNVSEKALDTALEGYIRRISRMPSIVKKGGLGSEDFKNNVLITVATLLALPKIEDESVVKKAYDVLLKLQKGITS